MNSDKQYYQTLEITDKNYHQVTARTSRREQL